MLQMLDVLPAPPSPGAGDAVFLDVDGTLCPIAARPSDVAFDDGLRALLGRAAERLSGALGLVSGRPLDWLIDQTAGVPLALAGTHGLELRHADGRIVQAPLRAGLAPALAAVRAFARQWPGLVVEAKARGIAIHYRQVPESRDAVIRLGEDLGRQHDLPVLHGKMVVELKGADGDKGTAIAALLREPQFAGRTPVFVGDDITDEAGFAAATAAGGIGILVGRRPGSAAGYALADPAAVRRWLGELA